MRRAILGALVGASLVAVATGLFESRGVALAQHSALTATGGGELIAVPSSSGDNKGQFVTVIDPRQQAICVYAIEQPSGKISLRSARNIHWDLQLSDFNSDNPLPKEIRLQLEQR